MHSALKTAKFLLIFAGTALFGFVPFWQWLTQGYAGGLPMALTALVWFFGVMFGLTFLPMSIKDPIAAGAISFGALGSLIVAVVLAFSATHATKGDTIITLLPDRGSFGITQPDGVRFYSPFDPNVRVVSATQSSVRSAFTLQCEGGEMCELSVSGTYEVSQLFIMNALLNGAENHHYYALVHDAATETLIADKPTTQDALQTGMEKRINQRLGLADEAPCPIHVQVSLFTHHPE